MTAISFLLGVCLIFWVPSLPNKWVLTCFAMLALGLFWFAWFKQRRGLSSIAACMAGFVWVMFSAGQHLQHRLPQKLEGKWLTVQGYVVSLPTVTHRRVQFVFRIWQFEKMNLSAETFLPLKVRLSIYGHNKSILLGSTCTFTVKLKRPHGFADPGAFDYERLLFQKSIGATGYVKPHSAIHCHPTPWWQHPFGTIRQNLDQRLTLLSDSPMLGFIKALVIGQRTQVAMQQWQILRATGTAHLLAISGLHISLIAGLLFFCWSWLWRCSARLCLVLPAPRAAAFAALIAAWGYAGLAGFALPTQRAVIMISILMWTWIGRQTLPASHGLSLALLLVLIWDPLAPLSGGFWLSFVAVGAIFYGVRGRIAIHALPRPQRIWWRWGRVQWVVSLALLPLSVWFFQQSALLAFVANSIAIPVVGMLVVPLSLLSALLVLLHCPGGQAVFWLATHLLAWVLQVLAWIAAVKLPSLPMLSSLWQLVCVIGGVLLILAPRGLPARWLALPLMLPWFFASQSQPGGACLSILDIGQGLAVVLRTEHHLLVYDTGPKYSEQFDTGSMVLVPFLKQAGVKQVDTLIISHGDNDHIGGAKALLAALPVKKILTSVPKRLGQGSKTCHAGQHWQYDGVEFTMLAPPEKLPYQGNNSSCVLQIKIGASRILLPGDIEKSAERELLKLYARADLQSMLIVAPHHGSKTSSSPDFLSRVKPKWVIYSTGYRNRFHFPHPSVVQRYQQLHAGALNTAVSGAITFEFNAKGQLTKLRRYRQSHQHIWS